MGVSTPLCQELPLATMRPEVHCAGIAIPKVTLAPRVEFYHNGILSFGPFSSICEGLCYVRKLRRTSVIYVCDYHQLGFRLHTTTFPLPLGGNAAASF